MSHRHAKENGVVGQAADEAAGCGPRRTRPVARVAVLGLVAIGLSAFTGAVAGATTGYGPYTVIGTGSNGLNERSGPSTSDGIVGHLANGASVMIACQAAGGTYSTGGTPSTDSIWDQLVNGAYVADFWMSTPAVGTFTSEIPRCGSQPPPPHVGKTTGSNPFPAGQCTWGADNLVHNLMVTDPSLYPSGHNFISVWGNADQWASSAASNGWLVNQQVAKDALVVFQPGVQGADRTYGHVALVTAVYGNGTFQIEEMNGPAGPGHYDYRTVALASGESFIHIPPFS